MKKITLTIASNVLFIATIFAQSKELKEVEKNYLLGKIAPAKEIIDKLAANPANATNAEVWIWKSTLDAEISNSDDAITKCSDCLTSSFDAFKKYENLDKSLALASQIPFKWKSLGIMYDKYYDLGKGHYKAASISRKKLEDAESSYNEIKVAFKLGKVSQSDLDQSEKLFSSAKNEYNSGMEYAAAFENFDKAAYFSRIIMQKDIRKNGGALDTLPVLMSAYAAQNAQKVNEALHYYSIAADFKFGGENDLDMYKYLFYNYSELKDKANFEKYYAIAQEKYPKENFEDYRFDFIAKNFSIDEKLAFYDAEDAKGTLSAIAYMSLGDMFVNLKKEEKEAVEKDVTKKTTLQTKGREAFKKAYQKGNDVLASFNVGVLYYNEYNQLDEQRSENVKKMQEINSSKPVEKDPKKKAAADAKAKEQIEPLKKANTELEPKIMAAIDNGVEWLEKTYTALKDKAEKNKTEKTSFKNAVKFLGLFYELKRDKVKLKDPKAYDAFDAKSKQYYEVYDKL